MKHQTIERTAIETLSIAQPTISAERLLDVVVGFSRKMNAQPKDDGWIGAFETALNELGAVVRSVDLDVAHRSFSQPAKSGEVLVGASLGEASTDDHAIQETPNCLTIVLDDGSQAQSAISVELETQLTVHALDQITILAVALSRLWRDRSINSTGKASNILSMDNPCGLTRSETRVCYALKDGMSPAKIADHFGIGIATVRTHLSNIYAKTGLPSQTAVVRQLSMEPQAEMRAMS